MSNSNRAKMALLSTAAYLLHGATPAIAQDGTSSDQESAQGELAAGPMGEILVTARKRSESLQKVPISIEAFTSEELEARGIDGIDGIELNTPGFTYDTLGSTQIRPAIRGIGSDEPGPGGDFSTAIFLDGIYLATPSMATLDIFDVARVEVLKGPQGTLFGKNVIGGAIDVIPNRPADVFEAQASLTAGNYGTLDLEGMVNIPTGGDWAQRLAFVRRSHDGFAKNLVTGNRLEDLNRFAFRYSIAGQVGDALEVYLAGDYIKDDNSGRNNQIIGATPGAGNPRAPTWLLLASQNRNLREETNQNDDFAKREMYGLRMELVYDLGFASLTSVSSYRDITDDQFDADDGRTLEELRIAADTVDNRSADYGFGTGNDVQTYSTELRLSGDTGPLDWIVGAYYGRADYDSTAQFPVTTFDCRRSNARFTLGLVSGVNGCSSVSANDRWDLTNHTDSYGLFADTTLKLTDSLSLSGGVRYSYDKKRFTNTNARSLTDGFTALNVATGIFAVKATQDWDAVTYRASLEYDLTPDIFTYASVSTGYKAGGFGTFTTSAALAAFPLNKETATNYELGIKTTLFDRHLRTSLALFRQDYTGLQTVVFSAERGAESTNAAAARIEGLEFEGTVTFGNISIDGSYTYLKTDVDGVSVGGTVFNNVRLQRAPKHAFSIGPRYTQDIGDRGAIEYGVNYSYRSKIFDDPDNNLGEVRPPRKLVDAYISWSDASDSWNVRLWSKNLFDEIYYNRISDSFGAIAVTLGPPRQFGVTVTRRFR